jgi:hypothetical protein
MATSFPASFERCCEPTRSGEVHIRHEGGGPFFDQHERLSRGQRGAAVPIRSTMAARAVIQTAWDARSTPGAVPEAADRTEDVGYHGQHNRVTNDRIASCARLQHRGDRTQIGAQRSARTRKFPSAHDRRNVARTSRGWCIAGSPRLSHRFQCRAPGAHGQQYVGGKTLGETARHQGHRLNPLQRFG